MKTLALVSLTIWIFLLTLHQLRTEAHVSALESAARYQRDVITQMLATEDIMIKNQQIFERRLKAESKPGDL